MQFASRQVNAIASDLIKPIQWRMKKSQLVLEAARWLRVLLTGNHFA